MRKYVSLLLAILLLFAAACDAGTETTPSASPTPTATPTPTPTPTPDPVELIDMSQYKLSDNVKVDQLGYRPGDPKRAVVPEDATEFLVVRESDGAMMFQGIAGDPAESVLAQETVRVADFSELTEPGTYAVYTGAERSHPFEIKEDAHTALRAALLDFFHYQKCGVELDAGVWSHAACHATPAIVLDDDGQYTDETREVSGGWHDAGDYGRYVVPAAQTVADLLLAYELSPNPDKALLDVTWFEIEWMLKMQDGDTGGVHHKVSCRGFNALNEMPDQETDALMLTPVSTTATADFAASMAMAARFYPDKKETLLKAAQSAWDWCLDNPDVRGARNPRGISTGAYGDGHDKDERFWAACELFAATGDEQYHDYIKAGEIYEGLGWADMGTFGLAAYLLHGNDNGTTDPDQTERMKKRLLDAAKGVYDRYEGDPYGISMGDFYWGSNMAVGNNAMTLLLAVQLDAATEKAYTEAALEHMHYLLGKNPLNFSYVSDYGENAMKNPHHRPSVAVGQAVPGMVSGGPNKNLEDTAVKNACEGQPPAKCYIDHIDSYSSNEITIYWNSPAYFAAAVLDM